MALAREPELLDDPRLTTLLPSWVLAAARGSVGSVSERAEVMKPVFARWTLSRRPAVGSSLAPMLPSSRTATVWSSRSSKCRRQAWGRCERFGPAHWKRLAPSEASDDLGSIRRGKLADLVILEADPVEDIRNLRRVERVILGGKMVEMWKLLAIRGAH